jgi:hypothetical protein
MITPTKKYAATAARGPAWLYWTALSVALGSGLRYCAYVTADPDLWGHIHFGEALWRSGTLEHVEIYSFTAPGHAWINHEWLAELVFFGLYRLFGNGGLLLAKLLTGLAIVLIVTAICRQRKCHPVVYAAVMIPAIISISPGFMIRPQLFSFLLFTIYLYVLHLFFSGNSNRLYLLPLLMVMWVNAHGGFLIGIVLLGAVAGLRTLACLAKQGRKSALNPLWIAFAATVLATLANPYGYKLHIFLYRSLRVVRPISEWNPVPILDGSFLSFKILLVIFAVAVIFARRKTSWWETGGLFLMLYASIRHQRHIPFFAIMAGPYLIHWGSRFMSEIQGRWPRTVLTRGSLAMIAVFFSLLAIYQAAEGIGIYRLAKWRIIVDPAVYPVAAVRFMAQNKFKGNLLLPFEWGEYAIWKLYPACRVSIDGRFRTAYPEHVIQDHFQAFQNREKFGKLLEKYPADLVLTRQSPVVNDLINGGASNWLYVYSDNLAVILIRDSSRNEELVANFKAKKLVYSLKPPAPYFP